MMEKKARGDYFIRNYYFSCKCQKCCSQLDENNQNENDLISVEANKCSYCNQVDSLIYDTDETSYKCLECGKQRRRSVDNCFESPSVDSESSSWLDRSNILLKKLKSLSSVNEIVKFEELLVQARALKIDTLDDTKPSWINFIKLSEHLMDVYIREENYLKAVSIASLNLCDNYIKYYPANHPAVGFLFLKVAKLFANLEDFAKAREYFEKADRILRIVYKNTGQRELFSCLEELNATISKTI